ncbi:MAG TPA: hypothetical protein VGR54_09650 [Nitrosopumilaceae archaeon]|nr:hypothetical protein [Nitrosopumilaceae archaeon]
MRRSIIFALTILVFIPLYSSVWATTDLTTLGSPDVTITPLSGPPGTTITITVSHLPDISKESYPYPDLYIYLPFSKPFGVTVPSHCGGEDCFPIYTHDDALKQNLGDRTITFSLFSKNNPSPIYDNGYENTICDVVVNNVITERYSTLCNTKDEPTGTYQIEFVWALETNLEKSHVAKTVQFTVTSGSQSPPPQVAENGNLVIKQYKDGTITGTEFVSKLRALGWNDEQIRQALAVIGKLPHQMGAVGPDNTQTVIQQINSSHSNIEKTSSVTTENNVTPSSELTPNSTTVQTPSDVKSSANSLPLQPTQDTSSSWNTIGIILSVGTAAIVVGVILVVKKSQKSTH